MEELFAKAGYLFRIVVKGIIQIWSPRPKPALYLHLCLTCSVFIGISLIADLLGNGRDGKPTVRVTKHRLSFYQLIGAFVFCPLLAC
jgi:hypothetical protein